MQRCIDLVHNSKHPDSKVAALIVHADQQHGSVNFWPSLIERAFGHEVRIGTSSGTLHAETAAIISCPFQIFGADLYITDPPCPNCAKNIVEAGIKNVFIDHKGFEKTFFSRRRGDFEILSIGIFKHAGVHIHKIHRKEKRLETILSQRANKIPLDRPVKMRFLRDLPDKQEFIDAATWEMNFYDNEPDSFAAILCTKHDGEPVYLSARPSYPPGFEHGTTAPQNSKYSLIMEPVNRLLMTAAKEGLKIQPDIIFTARCPTARELVNLIGAGFTEIHIEKPYQCRDDGGIAALKQLEKSGIIKIS